MLESLGEEYKHFCTKPEFALRRKPRWREIAVGVLFRAGDIVGHGEAAEAGAQCAGPDAGPRSASAR